MNKIATKRHPMTDKTKEKIRKRMLFIYKNNIRKPFWLGKKNPKHGKRMKIIKTGTKHSAETKRKMRLFRLKNPLKFWLGKKRPDMSKRLKGNKYAYINGEGYSPYSNKFNKSLKIKILKRDNFTCKKCHQYGPKKNNILNVHHIDYNKENCGVNNLITLCHSCNNQVNRNIDYWFAYFMYVLGAKL